MATILKINTTQNVNLDFVTASIGNRILAFIIDSIIKMAYAMIIFYIVGKLGITKSFKDQWSAMAFSFIVLIPALFYTLVLETFFDGQTIGKKLVKIKVVKIDGFQANFGDYFSRWVMQIIDFWTLSGVIGLIAIIISPRNQRLGDMVAGTAVISLNRNTHIGHTILINLEDTYKPKYPNVALLSDRDATIIKNNLDLAFQKNDRELIAALKKKLEAVLKVDASDQNDEYFIRDVLKDFNYYTSSH